MRQATSPSSVTMRASPSSTTTSAPVANTGSSKHDRALTGDGHGVVDVDAGIAVLGREREAGEELGGGHDQHQGQRDGRRPGPRGHRPVPPPADDHGDEGDGNRDPDDERGDAVVGPEPSQREGGDGDDGQGQCAHQSGDLEPGGGLVAMHERRGH